MLWALGTYGGFRRNQPRPSGYVLLGANSYKIHIDRRTLNDLFTTFGSHSNFFHEIEFFFAKCLELYIESSDEKKSILKLSMRLIYCIYNRIGVTWEQPSCQANAAQVMTLPLLAPAGQGWLHVLFNSVINTDSLFKGRRYTSQL